MALSGCYGVLKWIVFLVNLIFWVNILETFCKNHLIHL